MPPLAAGPHEVEQPVQQAPHVCRPRAASGFGSRDERFEKAILLVAQGLTGPVIPNQCAGLGRPHGGFFPGKPPRTLLLRRLFSPSSAFQNSLSVGEELVVAYRTGNTYDPTALARLQTLFRDVHQNVPGPLPLLLVDLLSMLQERWDYERPLLVTSGYRTLQTNASIEGAAPASLHLRGLAADVSLRGVAMADLANAALWLSRQLGFMGLGLYPRFLHLDIGPQRTWTRS